LTVNVTAAARVMARVLRGPRRVLQISRVPGVVPDVVRESPVPVRGRIRALAGVQRDRVAGTKREAAELVDVTRRVADRPTRKAPVRRPLVLDHDVFRVEAGVRARVRAG